MQTEDNQNDIAAIDVFPAKDVIEIVGWPDSA
jgi:hypothetical protein